MKHKQYTKKELKNILSKTFNKKYLDSLDIEELKGEVMLFLKGKQFHNTIFTRQQ